MKTKGWSECLSWPESEAYYEIDFESGKIVDARIIGYFLDDSERHQFVRWDGSHGTFHKHRLYEKKQGKEFIRLPLKQAFMLAKRDLKDNWLHYKRAFIKNHLKQ
jgi:hypothetical protein